LSGSDLTNTVRIVIRPRRNRRLLPVVIGAVALLTAGCFPITHSTFTIVDAPGSGVNLTLLSGDGNFAVVQASNVFERIDRRDNSVVVLPGTVNGRGDGAISRDGSRVLLGLATPATVVWSNGQVLTPPPNFYSPHLPQMSRDLTYDVFVDSDGFVKTWQTATQTVTNVEANFPRPAGTVSAFARGVSNDGRTVEYTLYGGPGSQFERFVNLDTLQAFDTSPTTSDLGQFQLAASGTTFLEIDHTLPPQAELIALPSGTVLRQHTSASGFEIATGGLLQGRSLISDSGNIAWIYEIKQGDCHIPPLPVIACTIDSHAVAMWARGTRSIGLGNGTVLDPNSMTISSNGRFLLLNKADNPPGDGSFFSPEPVMVVDFLNQVETLNQSDSSHLSSYGHISDDGKLVATTSTGAFGDASGGGGWYEYTASP
jgi:hypothetical protein